MAERTVQVHLNVADMPAVKAAILAAYEQGLTDGEGQRPDDRYPCPLLRCGWYLTAHELTAGDKRTGVPRASIAEDIAAHLVAVHVRRGGETASYARGYTADTRDSLHPDNLQ